MTVNPTLCSTDKGEPIKLGSRWREDDPRTSRIVTVVDYDKLTDRVRIKYVRPTWAKRSRFGRAGGYKPVPQESQAW